MKLHLPEFLRHLHSRPVALMAEHGMRLLPPGDKNRQEVIAALGPDGERWPSRPLPAPFDVRR